MEKWGCRLTEGSEEILQQGQSEEMGVFWATGSSPLDGIFDPSVPPTLVQGVFKDGGQLQRQRQRCGPPQGQIQGVCAAQPQRGLQP